MGQNWSLARRLLVGAAIWSLVMLLITGSVLSVLNRNQALALLHEGMDANLMTLTRAANSDENGQVSLDPDVVPRDQRYETPLSGRYWVFALLDADGRPAQHVNSNSVWDWDIPWGDFPLESAMADPGQTYYSDTRGPDNEPVRVAVKTVLLSNVETPVAIIVGADRRVIDRIARNFLVALTGAMIILALGLIIAMVIQVRVGLRPLRRVQQDVVDIRAGKKEKLAEDYPLEVAPLADELNKLLDHNKTVVDRARTHVGNLAHALKTPIAVLMNEARGDDAFPTLVRRQTKSMSENVEHYLKRAQAAARAEVLGARTEITPAINDLTRLLQRLFQDKGVDVAPGEVSPLVFRGERQDLDELLGNLLENACKWANAKVRVNAMEADNGLLVIHVDDDGPGLTPEEREQATKRGVRLDETAPGTGLGLSIVKDLAELYTGRFELSESPFGGLRASLYLPRA